MMVRMPSRSSQRSRGFWDSVAAGSILLEEAIVLMLVDEVARCCAESLGFWRWDLLCRVCGRDAFVEAEDTCMSDKSVLKT